MTARLLTVAALCLGLTSAVFAQEAALAPDEAAVTSPATAAGDELPRPTTAAAVEPVVAEPGEYRIGPEDVLDFHVWKNDELSRTVPVRPDGKISLPLVNDIQAAGLTPNQLRQQLTVALSPYFDDPPEVSVMVRDIHSFKVAVLGNVRMPNQYEVRSEATVLDLIARAQGLNEFADKGGIVVLRRTGGTEERLRFDHKKALEGAPGANFFVQPGDIIHVP
jgi:polysaccharide export outer membrane protein